MQGKVLVTGASGFIGGKLCEYLQTQGYQVRTAGRSATANSKDNRVVDLTVDHFPNDLCQDIDIIFHLAGKAHALAEHQQDQAEYNIINTQGTLKLLKAAKNSGVRSFIFFSSVKAVGDSDVQPMDETISIPADTPYGESKFAAEQLVLYGGFTQHSVVIRPCMVYGNTEKGNLPRMIKSIKKGFFPPLPELHNRRSMVHVEDVVQAAVLAARNPLSNGQVYIVSDQQDYSTRELYDLICHSLSIPLKNWYMPLAFLNAAAKFGDGIGWLTRKRFSLDSDSLRKLTESACYSSAKISNELGFRPKYTLRQCLPDIIQFLNLT